MCHLHVVRKPSLTSPVSQSCTVLSIYAEICNICSAYCGFCVTCIALDINLAPAVMCSAAVSGHQISAVAQSQQWPQYLSGSQSMSAAVLYVLQVCGYVQHVAKAGMFVTLSRDVVARVKLGNMAASFVEDPGAAFPPGTLVKGRVLSMDGSRYSTNHSLAWFSIFSLECKPLHSLTEGAFLDFLQDLSLVSRARLHYDRSTTVMHCVL